MESHHVNDCSVRGITNLFGTLASVGTLPYIILSLFCTVAVFRPDLITATYYRFADLCSLFLSQAESVF